MDHDEGVRLGQGWVADWNRHDLDAVMARLHDDIVFSSPHIPVMVGEPSGVLRGKPAVRAQSMQIATACAPSSSGSRTATATAGCWRWCC